VTQTKQKVSADKHRFNGYHQTGVPRPDAVLTHVGPDTPCGEYLRRYWHPVAITSEIGELPKLIKVLGEQLVIFRDRSGRFGLVHKHCPHRRASLEFGRCEERGIRCCYHGWLFDIDGTILDIPSEPPGLKLVQRVQQSVRLGAYPTREFRGLIFAYLGPPELQPEFPHYDAYDIADMVMSPYKAPFKCNWLQVLDAIVDPSHTAFLHHEQFTDAFGTLGEMEFYQRDGQRFLGSVTRRIDDNVWVRVNELILPNFTQSGAAFATDGTQIKYFGRSAFTRWVTPLDDENCTAFAWGNFGERGDPHKYNTPEGMQLIEQGAPMARSYEDAQRNPGDVEAVEGMGPITDHSGEHLLTSDRGITLYRKRLRELCAALDNGESPPQPTELTDGAIPTHGSDTVLRCPRGENDKATLRQLNDDVMAAIFSGDTLVGEARDSSIFEQLTELNKKSSAK
jgi:phenylpropionate dioxygenase-like ring-hydroxylating dioxygenase large terminal subunit